MFMALHHPYLWLTHARFQQVEETFKQELSDTGVHHTPWRASEEAV